MNITLRSFARVGLLVGLGVVVGCGPQGAEPVSAPLDAAPAGEIQPLQSAPAHLQASFVDDFATDVLLRFDGALRLDVANVDRAPVDWRVIARVQSNLHNGVEHEIAHGTLAGSKREELAVDLAELELPSEGLEFMAAITLLVRGDYANGDSETVALAHLFAEPTHGGFVLRSAQRVEQLEHGLALSARARAAQEQSATLLSGSFVEASADLSDPRLRTGLASPSDEAPAALPSRAEVLHGLAQLGFGEMPASAQSFGFRGADIETLHAADPLPNLQQGAVQATRQALVTSALCFIQSTTYVDANTGEDYWTETTADRALQGAFFVLENSSGAVASWGLLTSGLINGCVQLTDFPNGTYTAKIGSLGSVSGNTVQVQVNGGSGATQSVLANINVNGFIIVTIPPNPTFEEFNIYIAAAAHLGSFVGPVKATYALYSREPSTFYSWNDAAQPVRVSSVHAQHKHVIGHEMGHRFLHLHTASKMAYDLSEASSGACASQPNNHATRSKEWQSAAFHEGFATFFTAAVFNESATQDDGALRVNGNLYTLGAPTADVPWAWMEAKCPTPFPGFGNELDWARALWHTRTDGTGNPSIATMVSWLSLAPPVTWTRSNTFTNLDAMANTAGGSLNTKWDAVKDPHGVNW